MTQPLFQEPEARVASFPAASGTKAFTLVETIFAFAVLLTSMAIFGLVEVGNTRASLDLKRKDVAFARGQAILERIQRLPFGAPNLPALMNAELDRLFGSTDDVRTLSLTQLRQRDTNGDGVVDSGPIQFQLEGVEDDGLWEIHIDSDLDGNGVIDDRNGDGAVDSGPSVNMPTREGRNDLLRIEIVHDGRTVLKTIRSRTPNERDAAESLN